MRIAVVTFSALATAWLAFGLAGVLPESAWAQQPAATTPTAPAGRAAAQPEFAIHELLVEGNTVLPVRDIERVLTPFLGEQRHFADVEAARHALEEVYQRAGYQTVFVEIPEQKVLAGTIRLHVLEGRVGQTRVEGSHYHDLDQIRIGAAQFTPGSVPDFKLVQQDLAQLNKQADQQVAPILAAGKVPGTIDVKLSVKDELPLHGDIEDDNHASPFTTADRASASLHYDDLWQRGHSLALNYQLAPANHAETNVLYATYLWRFTALDDALSLYAVRSNSDIAVVGSSTILGGAKIAGLRWIHPLSGGLSAGANFLQSLTLGLDRKDFSQTNVAAQTNNVDVLPAITYYPLSLSYSLTLVRDERTLLASFGVVTAPRGVFGNTDAKFRSRRVLGDAGYFAWKPNVSVEQWILPRWSVYALLDGQWTNDPLISTEQYLTGGADSVRAYRESEISGDRGVRGTLEVRFYPQGRPPADGKRQLYLEVFTDGAQTRLVDPQGPQVAVATIASTGLGLHAQGWRGFHVALDLGKALRDGGRGVQGAITPNGRWRLEAALGWSF